jgi:hypothetical protein
MALVATVLALAAPTPATAYVPPPHHHPGCRTVRCERRMARRAHRHTRWRWARYAHPLMPTLRRIAWCESTMNPRAVSADGRYHGLLQFDLRTWAGVGGHGLPSLAEPAEQWYRGARLYRARGPAPWPVCGYR